MAKKKGTRIERMKAFSHEHHQAIIITAVLGLGLLLLLLSAGVTLRVSFLLGNDLLLDLSPDQLSVQGHYGLEENVSFTLETANPFYCTASCSYRFVDQGRDMVVDNGSFALRGDEVKTWDYAISPSRFGRGQDIYSFEARCQNLRQGLCLTDSPERQASSLVTLNYDLTSDEQAVKESVRQRFETFLRALAEADATLQMIQERTAAAAELVWLDKTIEENTALEASLGKLRIEAENLRRIWEAESYFQLDRRFNGSLEEEMAALNASLEEVSRALGGRITEYREASFASNAAYAQLTALNRTMAVALKQNATAFIGNISTAEREFNALMRQASEGNYSLAREGSIRLSALLPALQDEALDRSARELMEARLLAGFDRSALCRLRDSEGCGMTGTIREISARHYEIKENGFSSLALEEACSAISENFEAHAAIRNETMRNLAQQDITINASEDFVGEASALLQDIKAETWQDLQISLAIRSDDIFMDVAPGLLEGLKVNESGADLTHDGETLRLWLLNRTAPIEELREYQADTCRGQWDASLNLTAPLPVLAPLEEPQVNSTIDVTLSDNPPICCLFGECRPCCTTQECRQDPATYPVIFLHGHSFNKANAPAYSLEAFNDLQRGLEKEGYLHAGLVTPGVGNSIQPGEWGLSGKPVTVKATYYLDAFREEETYVVVPSKSENIDTYALRLRDIVSEVKERTGRPQVNIIAHSMGGLVARKYIQIFGGQDVKKLIMIGTPNQGISGNVNEYCPLFGERKECLDMQTGSLFLNKLNDPSREPAGVEMYTITGVGCRMDDGRTGDGVVLAENVRLEGAENFNITGTCGSLSNLHTEMLDVDAYPRILTIVEELLDE